MKLEDHQCPALTRGARLGQDPKTGEPMLLFPEGVIHLSDTAQEILLRCDGETTLASLIGKLADHYEVERDAIGHDVRDFLIELVEHNVVTI